MVLQKNLHAIIIVKYKVYMGDGYYNAAFYITPHSVEFKHNYHIKRRGCHNVD
jgi:hypothetical protein